MSTLQGCLSYSDFHVTGVFIFIVMFILQGCPSYRVVYLMRVFVLYSYIALQGAFPMEYLPYRGVHLTLVSGLWGVHFTGVSILTGFPPERGVSYSGVCVTGVCAMHWCLPLGSVELKVDFHYCIIFMCIHM